MDKEEQKIKKNVVKLNKRQAVRAELKKFIQHLSHYMDEKTLSYINMYAILKALPLLCEMDEKAKELASFIVGKNGKKKPFRPINIGLHVTDGPFGVLRIGGGKIEFLEIKKLTLTYVKFFSFEHFNHYMSGVTRACLYGGFHRLSVLRNFKKLIDRLFCYLYPTSEQKNDAEFFEKSTKLLFYTGMYAISEVGNRDVIAINSTRLIPNGTIQVTVGGEEQIGAYIVSQKNILETKTGFVEHPRAKLEIADLKTAREILLNRADMAYLMTKGIVRVSGYLPMTDSFTKIMSRTLKYAYKRRNQ